MLNNSKFYVVLFLAMFSLGLVSCETIEGAGRDIEHAGQSIKNAAD